jgi:hypothetical protein
MPGMGGSLRRAPDDYLKTSHRARVTAASIPYPIQ